MALRSFLTGFLRRVRLRFSRFFRRTSPGRRSGPPPPALEPWARFIYSVKQFAATTGRVKYQVFYPPKGRTDLSGFMIGGLSVGEAFAHGDEHAPREGRGIKACATLARDQIEDAGLTLDFDDSPPRHANVLGFPPLVDEEDVAKHHDLANELCASAVLIPRR